MNVDLSILRERLVAADREVASLRLSHELETELVKRIAGRPDARDLRQVVTDLVAAGQER